MHAENVKVDVARLCGVRHQSEAERVRATLRNAIGEILGLPVLGLLDLLRIQVSVLKSSMQIFEGDTLHHLDGIDHVAEGLGHLAAVCVAHHGVQIHLLERHLAREREAHHHHARHPEEEDVVPRLQQRPGEKVVQVRGLLRPSHGGEGEQARGEPRVQHVGVLSQRHLGARVSLLRNLERVLLRAPHHPAVHGLHRAYKGGSVFALQSDVVGRDAVPPPELARDAPVANVFQPPVPRGLKHRRDDVHATLPHHRHRLRRHLLAVHPPLGLDEGLNHILGA
mmetsp:Transcript_20475/g.38935  ORF Transcript_20475/g.38935 Transcript_20475/m.38935 type:complete len:281 (-) Transcript_20475:239-1081(-)